jgi:hypothetical protein
MATMTDMVNGEPLAIVRAHVTSISLYLALLFALDTVVCRTRLGAIARWQSIHAGANLLITSFCMKDAVITTLDPIKSCLGQPGVDYSLQPVYMIVALHTYHMVPGLGFRLSGDDYFHHLLFGGLIGSAGIIFTTGVIQNFIAFFICGLPGGLDYIMLVLVKLKKINYEDEKVWNSRINVWVRSPGLMASALLIYISSLYGDPESPCRSRPILAIFAAFLIFFNGQYYSQVVVGNTFRKVKTYNS